MRPIYIASVDKRRPVVILTREAVRPHIRRITVAPITTTVRGLSTEVSVGTANGLSQESVVSLDNVATVDQSDLVELVGYLTPEQERKLALAIVAAYDLEIDVTL